MPRDTEVSDAAVQKATGQPWRHWYAVLDAWDATTRPHKEVAAYLHEQHGLSGWWSQTVTVQYERARGLRRVGETAGGGYQVGVVKTMDVDLHEAWRLVTGPRGLRLWLGPGAPRSVKEGQLVHLEDGTQGEVRVVKPESHLRITWQPPGWRTPSVLQVRVLPRAGDRAAIQFHHEALPSARDRESMRARWKAALGRLSS